MSKKRSSEVLSDLPPLDHKLAYRLLRERDAQRAERASNIFEVKNVRRSGSTITGLVGGTHKPYYKCSITLASQNKDTNKQPPSKKKAASRKPPLKSNSNKPNFSLYVGDFSCNCPDWGNPCKHVGALLLQFAKNPKRFQEVPSIPSLLKGLKKSELQDIIVSLSESSNIREKIYSILGYGNDDGEYSDEDSENEDDEDEDEENYYY